MSMFSDVIIEDNNMLPKYLRNKVVEYQTKDCVEPEMETLIITKDGHLVYQWYEYESIPDDATYLKFRLEKRQQHLDILAFHGDMRICALDLATDKIVDLVARFTEGKLMWIKDEKHLT